MKRCSRSRKFLRVKLPPPDFADLAKGRKAGKRDQCWRSIFSEEFQDGWEVRKVYFGPTISPVKKVVRVGWSSVRPVVLVVSW